MMIEGMESPKKITQPVAAQVVKAAVEARRYEPPRPRLVFRALGLGGALGEAAAEARAAEAGGAAAASERRRRVYCTELRAS